MRMSFAHSFIAKMENGPHRQTYVKSNDPIAFYAMQLYILQWHLQEYIQFFFWDKCVRMYQKNRIFDFKYNFSNFVQFQW